jgi:hypothetical protein
MTGNTSGGMLLVQAPRTFNVEYSTNGGTTWNAVASNVAADRRYQDWFGVQTPTDKLKVRVTASNGMQDTSDSTSTVMSPPVIQSVTTPCNGYIQLIWNAVTGADHYEVFTIKDEALSSVATTSSTSIIIGGFSPDSAIWISVAGVFQSGKTGLKSTGYTTHTKWRQSMHVE